MNAVRIIFACGMGIVVALGGVAQAGLYTQDFTFSDGTTILGDGSDIRSNIPSQGQVIGGQLRMTTALVNGAWTVYRIPALYNSSLGFTATFNFDLSDSYDGAPPADGFSFVYGDIPAFAGLSMDQFGYGSAEEGMGADNEISFQIDTWQVGDTEHGYNLGMRLGGVEQADPFSLNTDILVDGGAITGGSATASWDPTNGASMVVDLGAGPTAIFTNVPTPGFTGGDAYTFAFSGRTGGASETLNLDNVNIETIPDQLRSVGAMDLAVDFTPSGGAHGLGQLVVSEQAEVVVEHSDGTQTGYADGYFEMTASLFKGNLSGDSAVGEFTDGTLAFRDSGGDDLLLGNLIELTLYEVGDDIGMLAGDGLFEVSGGLLAHDFASTHGEIFQIVFQIDPSDIDNFLSRFEGFTNITVTPTPEPATMTFLALGGIALLKRRR